MKKIFTKLSAFVVCFALLLTCSFGAANLSVSAETELPTFTSKVGVNTYEYTVTGGEATIIKATAKGDVIIPETLDGYPVVALGDKAFYYQWDIESVTVPSCVKTIGDGCFRDCINMKSAVIEDGVEKIGAYAFYSFVVIWGEDDIEAEYYSSLESLVLPDSVKYIGESAFLDTLLSGELKLPASLQYLGESAFSGCSSLTSMTIGNSVTSIGNSVFNGCTALTTIIIPNSVASIGSFAFGDCSSLTSVAIPNSVTYIGDYAFYHCTDLI